MKAFSVTGNWWLPEEGAHVVGGTLSFSYDNGIQLELFGTIEHSGSSLEQFARFMGVGVGRTNYPIIIGSTSDNRLVTLYDCDLAGTTGRSNGLPSEWYHATSVFFGAHFAAPEELVFQEARVQFTHLSDWAGRARFITREAEVSEEGAQAVTITYARPDDVVVATPHATISIVKHMQLSGTARSRTLAENVWVTYDSTAELSLNDWLVQHIMPMQNLLSLATSHPNAITDLEFVVDAHVVNSTGESETHRAKIDVIFHGLYQDEPDTPGKNLHPQDMLFTLADIDDVSVVLNCWYQISGELKTLGDLFFGAQYAPAKYSSSRFLINAQAIEIYDRTRFENFVMPIEGYKQKVASIVEAVAEEHREWLRGVLQFSNEPRLLERVQRVFHQANDVLLPLVRNKEKFAQRVKNTRNYFTHYSPSLQRRAASGVELYWLDEALFFLLQRSYLHELGFSSEQCVALFERNKRYLNARQHAVFSWVQVISEPGMNEAEARALIEEIREVDAQFQPQLRIYYPDFDPETGEQRHVVVITNIQTGAEQGFRHRDEWIAYQASQPPVQRNSESESEKPEQPDNESDSEESG